MLAAVGFLIGGIDDLAIDAVYWFARLTRRRPDLRVTDLGRRVAGRIAIFVPAWDESAVIGGCSTPLARLDYRLPALRRRLSQRSRDDRGGRRRRERDDRASGW